MVIAAWLRACGHIDPRLVEFFPRQRPLIEELLAALEDLFLRIERLLRLLRVGLGLPDFLRQTGGGRSFVAGLGLLVAAFVFLCGGTQIAVFQHGQQLSLANRAAALHQKLLHRSADLGHDRGLLPRKQNRLRVDRVLNRGFFYGGDLHRDRRFLVALVGRAAHAESACQPDAASTGDREHAAAPEARFRDFSLRHAGGCRCGSFG